MPEQVGTVVFRSIDHHHCKAHINHHLQGWVQYPEGSARTPLDYFHQPLLASHQTRPALRSTHQPLIQEDHNHINESFLHVTVCSSGHPLSDTLGKTLMQIGTWLDSDNGYSKRQLPPPSNVTRMTRAIKAVSSDGVSQIVFYQNGIGSTGGSVSRVVGGATAEGLSENIREGYNFGKRVRHQASIRKVWLIETVANNYSPGDEIFFVYVLPSAAIEWH